METSINDPWPLYKHVITISGNREGDQSESQKLNTKMMESTVNGGENNAFSEQENPFQDGERIVEEVQIVDEEAAAEAARREEIEQQMAKVKAMCFLL